MELGLIVVVVPPVSSISLEMQIESNSVSNAGVVVICGEASFALDHLILPLDESWDASCTS